MLIGVYNDRKHPLDLLMQERITSYLEEASLQEVTLFFFFIDDVDFSKQTIKGRFFETGKWIEKSTSFPQIILNDSSTSQDKVRNLTKEIQLKSEIPFISHLIEDKLTIFKKMKEAASFENLFTYQVPSLFE